MDAIPEIIELRRAVEKARGGVRRTPREVAERVMKLMRIRSNIDKTAWNVQMKGPDGLRSDPRIRNWEERHLLLVSIGIAFEDMPEVLEMALGNGDADSVDASLLWCATDAHLHLATARLPVPPKDDGVGNLWKNDQDEAMRKAWTALCDEVADIIRLPPRYGLPAA